MGTEASGRGPMHVPPGGERSFWLLGELYTAKALGEDTDGAFAFVEATTPPQSGPPPHVHHREDETFWVLEGELEFVIGGSTVRAAAGSFVHAPKGTPHAYKNAGTTPARYVATIRPAGLERFFIEVSEPRRPVGTAAGPRGGGHRKDHGRRPEVRPRDTAAPQPVTPTSRSDPNFSEAPSPTSGEWPRGPGPTGRGHAA